MRWISFAFLSCLISGLVLAAPDDFEALLRRGETYFRQGQYHVALDDLRAARELAATPEQQARAVGMLGLAYFQMRNLESAATLLSQVAASSAGSAAERVHWKAALASLRAGQGRTAEARGLYAEALKLAGGDAGLAAEIRLDQAALLSAAERLAELQRVRAALGAVANPEVRAHYLLNIGNQAHGLGTAGLKLAYESFEEARQNAGAQPRLLAEALGGFAQLYEDQGRGDEALRLDRQAIQSVQGGEAHDLLLELEWRQGRLHRARKQIPEALASYQRAVEHIEAIRQDIPVEYHDGRSSFRETLEPVYLGLADLLLEEAGRHSGEDKMPLLRRARETVELIKQSEIEDFLGGRCAVQSAKKALLETVEPGTAVIYPIILPERLELLVSLGSEVRQFTQPVDAATLEDLARKTARALRGGKGGGQILARQLYQWLIAPTEPWLRQRQVRTLVVVPDGVLRLIPMGALYDGEHYLIEKYALATSPGLTLFEPSPLQRQGIKALLAGMSEPGPVVERLPPAFLQAMAGASGRGAATEDVPKSRALPVSLEEAGGASEATRQIDAERLAREPAFRQKLKEELSLPGVAKEIDSLRQQIPNTLLMNESFTVDNFKRQVVQEPYSVVHIASHGIFGHTADTSFLMAYDGVIDIDELERLLKSDKFAKQPVELLTLSACQTAEGDDRAPLGLSGVAIKARVRSALGTLWPVSDEAAALLMAEFYKALSQPGTSKVQALQKAQVALLRQKGMEHPFYWSPFILVGNWL